MCTLLISPDPCRQLRSNVINWSYHCTISVQLPYMAVLDFESGKALFLLSETRLPSLTNVTKVTPAAVRD